MSSLDVVDLGHGVSVDRDLELTICHATNRMDRHFEVGMLTVLPDQEVVRVDLTDMSKQRAVEGSNRGSHRNVSGTVRIVSHLHLLWAGAFVSRLVRPERGNCREREPARQNSSGSPVRLLRKLGAQVISFSGTASRRSG